MLESAVSRRLSSRSPTRRSLTDITWQALSSLIVLLLAIASPSSFAESVSDLLIALESDGRSHTVQHTLATEDELLIVDLPRSVIPQDVRFMGPKKETFIYAHTKRPERIALWSGSAFARYHHQYGNVVEQTDPGTFVLTTSSLPTQLILRDNSEISSSITWVFPTEFEFFRYSVSDESIGQWTEEENTLTFRQTGGERAELTIEYRYRKPVVEEEEKNPCDTASAANDACSPDDDGDGVPDYRDVCLTLPDGTQSAGTRDDDADDGTQPASTQDDDADNGTQPASTQDDDADNGTATVSSLGCVATESLVLEGISFATGRSYIDVYARRLLDRVANAMQHQPEKVFEIGAHTDNQGTLSNNQRLSRKRADAVRHYLMLRGVGPNQVQAKGYGESSPASDNSTAEGRSRNRRVELTELQ